MESQKSANFCMGSERLIWLSKDASSFVAMIEPVCWVDDAFIVP